MEKIEAKIQQEIVVWFRREYKDGIIFSVPNERSSGWKNMISTGMLPGVSDLIVILRNKIIFVEVKDHKGKQSDKQFLFEQRVTEMGYEYHLVRNLTQFIDIINK